MTDVPYGRGGSPLQNLILRGHKSTVVSALRMIEELDAGPVYAKLPLSLDGSAEEIYGRAADLVYDLISEIVLRNPTPVAQAGEPTVFARRTPEQSLLPSEGTPPQAYDFIRMLDASTYPRAYLQHGSLRMEFSQAHLISDEEVVARVVIRRADQ
jgi:methionyl-tRNA formyltransferase